MRTPHVRNPACLSSTYVSILLVTLRAFLPSVSRDRMVDQAAGSVPSSAPPLLPEVSMPRKVMPVSADHEVGSELRACADSGTDWLRIQIGGMTGPKLSTVSHAQACGDPCMVETACA